jgi:hypothetical protein
MSTQQGLALRPLRIKAIRLSAVSVPPSSLHSTHQIKESATLTTIKLQNHQNSLLCTQNFLRFLKTSFPALFTTINNGKTHRHRRAKGCDDCQPPAGDRGA